jgi:hypothetical protein
MILSAVFRRIASLFGRGDSWSQSGRSWNAANSAARRPRRWRLSICCAAGFWPPYACFGSFSTEWVWTKRSLRSAMPPIATEFTRHDESSRSANCGLMHRSKPHLHSITSSARASRVGGTSRPSAFAVFRLTTSSYLVGAWTGRSAAFSPLRMRSTYAAERRTMLVVSGP